MAKKNRKNINQFKEALFSNTDFLKGNEPIEKETITPEIVVEKIIDDSVYEKFKILAKFENIDKKELINKALNHYLKLKGLQLEQAIKEANK